MANNDDQFKKVISHAKEYGYVFQSSEIYDGLSAVYDYAQNGVELKKNIRDYWWRAMVQMHDNIVGLDAAIFMHPTTWKASGHVDAFNDPLIDNKDSKKRYRADVLVEDYCLKIEAKIDKEVKKAEKRFGEAFNKEEFLSTNGRVLGYQEKIDTILKRLGKSLENEDLADVKALIEELEIACPLSGSKNWTDVKQFNLMFGTKLGASADSAMDLYLRPETAQGIFVNFLNVQKTGRMKIPFGIAQTGKAFRNEIVARQFIFRMREFEQMEMQYFIKPGTQKEWFDYWKETRLKWHKSLGLGEDNYRFHDHEKLAHYADATDIEFKFPFGFKELEGIHSRTDFDLKQHEEYSGKKLQYFDNEDNTSYTPYVLETSIGLDRMFLAVFSNSLQDETLEDGSERTVLKLPAVLAPTKAAILPLVKKDEGLTKMAKDIVDDLKWDFNVTYDEKDAVGRRYRRQDAAGTPFCITVDGESLENNTVTIRHRDTMEQKRVKVEELRDIIKKEVDVKEWLMKM